MSCMQCVGATLEKTDLDHIIPPSIFLSYQAKLSYLCVHWIITYATNAPQKSAQLLEEQAGLCIPPSARGGVFTGSRHAGD